MVKVNITYNFSISKEAFDLLKEAYENKHGLEYRDAEFETIEDFMKSDLAKSRDLEWFMNRNSNGTYKLALELLELNLLDDGDGMAWHTTYYVSDFGKEILKQNNIKNYDEESL